MARIHRNTTWPNIGKNLYVRNVQNQCIRTENHKERKLITAKGIKKL